LATVEMITPDPGLILPESESVPPYQWCSGLVLPESESAEEKMIPPDPWSVDMMLDDLWPCPDPMLMDSEEDDTLTWAIHRMVLPESGSRMILPERGMDPYAEEEWRWSKWESEHPEKERSIRSMLESLELDEAAEKMKAMPDESISLVGDAVHKAKAAEVGKRRKKVMVTVSQEHIDYMMEHPLPPPYKPIGTITCSMFREALDMCVASQEAKFKEREL
jgi:hypothetical protein